jgi:hypothetical protein
MFTALSVRQFCAIHHYFQLQPSAILVLADWRRLIQIQGYLNYLATFSTTPYMITLSGYMIANDESHGMSKKAVTIYLKDHASLRKPQGRYSVSRPSRTHATTRPSRPVHIGIHIVLYLNTHTHTQTAEFFTLPAALGSYGK